MWASRSKIDESVRAARLEQYPKLWRMSELLPMWPVAANVTYQDLRSLSEEMRDWYFREGGMYLSQRSRELYGAAQKEIAKVTGGRMLPRTKAARESAPANALETVTVVEPAPKTGPVTWEDYAEVQERLSLLRTSMTQDLLARSRTLTIPG